MSKFVVIFSTAPSEREAAKIARALVLKRLIACMNIVPKVRSLYRWKGRIWDEKEVMMVMKSKSSLLPGIKKELKRIHPYECPELVSMPIYDGLPDYLDWICENTR